MIFIFFNFCPGSPSFFSVLGCRLVFYCWATRCTLMSIHRTRDCRPWSQYWALNFGNKHGLLSQAKQFKIPYGSLPKQFRSNARPIVPYFSLVLDVLKEGRKGFGKIPPIALNTRPQFRYARTRQLQLPDAGAAERVNFDTQGV